MVVYPRWRGELDLQDDITEQVNGLSPLARGTRRYAMFSDARNRFIPAGAGNSAGLVPGPNIRPVYPRWRGELISNDLKTLIRIGLSPLARGTLFTVRRRKGRFRFIPAGAGNSSGLSPQCRSRSVYPRWRGELVRRSSWDGCIIGLSPLARGTLITEPCQTVSSRFIPAGAGNSHARRGRLQPTSVYPRWRGELAINAQIDTEAPGLSPLARGTL